jgi:hypothetical protein
MHRGRQAGPIGPGSPWPGPGWTRAWPRLNPGLAWLTPRLAPAGSARPPAAAQANF